MIRRFLRALWEERHEVVNTAFQRYVWLSKEDRKAYEEWRKRCS